MFVAVKTLPPPPVMKPGPTPLSPFALRKNGLFWSFSYVCPEPVLVKSSFLYRNGSKRPFSYQISIMHASPYALQQPALPPLVSKTEQPPRPILADATR
jgi:hypothetical protein